MVQNCFVHTIIIVYKMGLLSSIYTPLLCTHVAIDSMYTIYKFGIILQFVLQCMFSILQLFKEDPETGLTHMALSSDSTCVNHLYSAQDGYETLHMEKIEQPQQPQDIMVSSARCEFPAWMKGTWEGLTIGNNGEFSFRDEENFVTYRGHCVTEMPPAEENLDGLEGQRYLLFLSTDCGTTSYSCALFQRRDVNVLEFQLGKQYF